MKKRDTQEHKSSSARLFKNINLSPIFVVTFLFCLLPFVYLADSVEPETTIRFFLFAAMILALQVYFLLIGIRCKIKLNKEFFLENKVELAFALYIVYTAINLFRSYDLSAAVFDWLRLFLMFIFFVQLSILLRKFTNMRNYFIIGIATSIFIFSVYASIQIVPLLFNALVSKTIIQVDYSICSTLSNKNYFSETLFMSLPFLIEGFLNFRGLNKFFVTVAILFSVILILFLQSISVLIALFISFSVFIILSSAFKVKSTRKSKTHFTKKKKNIVYVLSISVLFIVFLCFKTDSLQNLRQKVISFSDYISYSGDREKEPSQDFYGSFTQRYLVWKHTLKMVNENPITGCGFSNWKTVFPKQGAFGNRFMDKGNIRIENPHNEYLSVLAETGLIGLVLFLSIFILTLLNLFSKIRNSYNEEENTTNILVFSGIIGFMIIACFSFPLERFFSSLLLIIAFSFSDTREINIEKERNKPVTLKKYFFLFPILLCGLSSYFLFIRLDGEMHFTKAINSKRIQDWEAMEKEISLSKSFALQSDLTATPLDWYKGYALFYQDKPSESFFYFQNAVKLNPFHIQAWNDLGTCYQLQKNYPEAINCYKKALVFNRNFYDAILNLSAAYFNSGNIESAYQTIILYPSVRKSQTYHSFLLAILKGKLQKVIDSVLDKNLMMNLSFNLSDENYLITIFNESITTNKNIDSIFLRGY